jgi:hypothetical protein
VVALFGLVLGEGSGWMYIVALNTNVPNFSPRDRGRIVGLLACCFGLCSGVFGKLRNGFFPVGSCGSSSSIAPFLLFMSIATSSVAVLGTLCVRLLPGPPRPTEYRIVSFGYATAAIITLFICASSFAEQFAGLDPFVSACILLALLSCVLFLIILGSPLCMRQFSPKTPEPGERMALIQAAIDPPATTVPLKEAVRDLDFWLIFIVFFASIGAGVTVVNNLPELLISRISLSYDRRTILDTELPSRAAQSSMSVLFSVCNTLGRLLTGLASDMTVHRWARSWWLVVAVLLMGGAQVRP